MAILKLTPEAIAEIAALHGLDADDPDVVESVEQAQENAGKKGSTRWAVDDCGVYCAAKLLNGYLDQIVWDDEATANDYAKFRRDTYGDD